jgi:membrane protein DedA with SNARE-associated domain
VVHALDSLTQYVSSSNWTYVYLVVVCALDSIFPLVPSETSVILGGVLAGSDDLVLWLVILAASAGAFLGDNIAYWIGRKAGPWIEARFFSGSRAKNLAWAKDQIGRRGGYLLVIARFIPGGRTAVTVGCGILHWEYRRFVFFDVIAAVLWGTYAALLGYAGGRAFSAHPWQGFLVAFAVALAVTGAVELYRWWRGRRRARTAGG